MATERAIISDDVGGFLDVSSGSGKVTFTVSDWNGQPMSEGTTVTLATANGEIFGDATIPTPRTSFNGALTYEFDITSDGTPDVGPATLSVVSEPSGTKTTYGITVSDVPPAP
jgi:hypothetical protein